MSHILAALHIDQYDALFRILRYLLGIITRSLLFLAMSHLELHAYISVDWADDPTTRKSTINFCIFLGDSQISMKSNKQLVSLSSTEAEYHVMSSITKEIIQLRRLFGEKQLSHRLLSIESCKQSSIPRANQAHRD